MVENIAKRGKKRKAPATSVTKAKESQEITKESPEITKSSMQENSIANEEPTNKENDQITEQKVSKKRKRPVTEGCNTGVYTELEEKNFVEALVLFGRDWAKVFLFVFKMYHILNVFFYRFKLILELGTAIRFEAMLKSTLLNCIEIKCHYRTK